MGRHEDAIEFNERGNICRESGNWHAAIELYEQATKLAPKWSAPAYNLGLVYKYQLKWEESRRYNQLATKLAPDDQAAWWNLGIAATALGDWVTARAAWRGFGIDIPRGNGPLDFPCGYSPIRPNPDGNAEVVWAHRICPARARLDSIPFPESNHRWRDVVLNDGAPVGYRRFNGKDVSVFNELQLLEASEYGTFSIHVRMQYSDQLMLELNRVAVEQACNVENWTQSIEILCKACSEGTPHEHHDEYETIDREGPQRLAIAAPSKRLANQIVKAWQTATWVFPDGELAIHIPPKS